MSYDFLIIGAGISGSAAAYELAAFGSVLILEAESTPGYHSTGRSAALYTPNYGCDLVRRINRLSYEFLSSPPAGFTDHSLLKARGMMTVMSTGQEYEIETGLEAGGNAVVALDSVETLKFAPFLHADQITGAVYEQNVSDMDVAALHQGFLRGVKQRGGVLLCGEPVTAFDQTSSGWDVRTMNQRIQARVVINAAGAWADEVGMMAGLQSIGLVPKRRTAMLVDAPAGIDVDRVPAIGFAGIENYIKPEAGVLMVSPGDEKPVEPQDIQADEMDVACLVDWLERETSIEIKRVKHTWAGLRCFVPDSAPIVGFESTANNFFWLAAQGGYGIMMSSALARATASLITRGDLPLDFVDAGVSAQELSVQRLEYR